MARTLTRTLALLVTAFAVAPAAAHGSLGDPASAAARLEDDGVRDIVVRRRPGLDREARAEVREDAGVQLRSTLRMADTEVVRAAPGRLAEAVDELEDDPGVVYAEPDAPVQIAPADPFWSRQWPLLNSGQGIDGFGSGTADADIDAPEAWALGVSGAGQTVAVVDTGVNASHPDLATQFAASPAGYDFYANDGVPADENGHGTHVSGTIAAAQDGAGISGVAPGARLVALRALGPAGTGNASKVAQAFDYAGDAGVKIVNASLASPTNSTLQRDAIAEHPETLYVIAAGNDGLDTGVTPSYPCNIPLDNVICVAATDFHDMLASFSNYGPIHVDLAAPGVSIVSDYGSGYAYMEGTSMAAPHVAATVALMRQAAPSLTAAQLRIALLSSVDVKTDLATKTVTSGRLNARAAVDAALAASGRPVPAPDNDLDGVVNASDNCPAAGNPSQGDGDRDGLGDACEPPAPVAVPAAAPAVAPAAPALTGLTALRATATLCRTARNGCRTRPAIYTVRVDRSATLRAQVERRTCSRGPCRFAAAATVSQRARAGTNTVKIGAGNATRRLASGTYRMRLVAVRAGARSRTAQQPLKVRRR